MLASSAGRRPTRTHRHCHPNKETAKGSCLLTLYEGIGDVYSHSILVRWVSTRFTVPTLSRRRVRRDIQQAVTNACEFTMDDNRQCQNNDVCFNCCSSKVIKLVRFYRAAHSSSTLGNPPGLTHTLLSVPLVTISTYSSFYTVNLHSPPPSEIVACLSDLV